ncbi:MAG TPA: SBBP repeat-containing protein [Acidobacteriaceae bacterium]|nr:SBBP repeat-containing protein [Acidobacteriaceae bacterium]
MRNILFRVLVLTFALLGRVLAAPAPAAFDRPLAFEPNRGQAPARFSWTARGQGYQLFVGSTGAYMTVAEPAAPSATDVSLPIPSMVAARLATPLKGRVSVIAMNLPGSHPWTEIQALEPTGGVSNYLLSEDRRDWHSDIPQYGRLRVKNVYDGVDLVFYGHGHELEYDFVLAPGGDPNQIRLAFEGAASMRVDSKSGDLMIKTKAGLEMRHLRPRVYQQIGGKKVEGAGGYQILDNGQAAFRLAAYDRRSALVVDPTVQFTTFLDGNLDDYGVAVAADAQGNSYVTGETYSTDFPDSDGAIPPRKNCPHNAGCPGYIFVIKLSPTGTVLNSTLIGGSDTDLVAGIAVTPVGVWVAGSTSSQNFGTHTQFGLGFWNGFIARLTTDLSQLEWCVTFGGFGPSNQIPQGANAIAVSQDDNSAYVTGFTASPDFPTSLYTTPTLQPEQKTLDGTMDAFVVKVGADGYLSSGYSTYLGGQGFDVGQGIAVDRYGHAYVTGVTSSYDFPLLNAKSHGYTGVVGTTAFVTEFSADGSRLVYSVLLGGTKTSETPYPMDQGLAIALDPANDAYVAGIACSSDFPVTPHAYQMTPPSDCLPTGTRYTSAFAAELSSAGELLHATYLGAVQGAAQANSVAVSPSGNIYVAGFTNSGSFPGVSVTSVNPSAGFLTQFGPKLEGLKSTNFLGAAINGITIFSPPATNLTPASVLTTGYRYPPGVDTTNLQNQDAFIVKLSDTE